MNRQERRKLGFRGPLEGPTITDTPSTVNAHGVCRCCGKRTFLWLPGRLCTPCVDVIAREMPMRTAESDEAMLRFLEELDEAEDVGA